MGQNNKIWDVGNGREMKKLLGHSRYINDVKFSFNGQQLVSSSNDKTIGVWDVQLGVEIQRLEEHSDAMTRVIFAFFKLWSLSSNKVSKKFFKKALHSNKLNKKGKK
ncbi:WD-40 repeat-containing protein [Reticulomyxa filosa]|uniref:WD-40 repeat-containing protein n=1 Tax=Reticulomyxa filosa TaxID=46433 RepID=X6LJ01_RETFI|nr:WD-40 repeat-containing protein [Reticulomyxa filosa]|eukprot:ETO01137.1 WD-40 repeat-containing protein [Reticulomyxa filosa]